MTSDRAKLAMNRLVMERIRRLLNTMYMTKRLPTRVFLWKGNIFIFQYLHTQDCPRRDDPVAEEEDDCDAQGGLVQLFAGPIGAVAFESFGQLG